MCVCVSWYISTSLPVMCTFVFMWNFELHLLSCYRTQLWFKFSLAVKHCLFQLAHSSSQFIYFFRSIWFKKTMFKKTVCWSPLLLVHWLYLLHLSHINQSDIEWFGGKDCSQTLCIYHKISNKSYHQPTSYDQIQIQFKERLVAHKNWVKKYQVSVILHRHYNGSYCKFSIMYKVFQQH